MSTPEFKDRYGQVVNPGDWIATMLGSAQGLAQVTKISKEGNLLCHTELVPKGWKREKPAVVTYPGPCRIINQSSSRRYVKVPITDEWIKNVCDGLQV